MVFGSIADIFFQWEVLGVFEFVLPFLLIFAIIYGILSSTHFLGDNRGVYVIISVVIGLISLRFTDFFSAFISQLFPRLGVGLAIVLAILILVGLFINKDETRYWGWGLSAIGAVIGIIIIYQTFERMGILNGYFFNDTETIGFIVLAVLVIGVIIAVSASGGRKDSSPKPPAGWLPWPTQQR